MLAGACRWYKLLTAAWNIFAAKKDASYGFLMFSQERGWNPFVAVSLKWKSLLAASGSSSRKIY
jgi:hypothetical protein